MKLPDEIGGAETRGANLIVKDADAAYTRAKAADADILFDIEEKPYGGRLLPPRSVRAHLERRYLLSMGAQIASHPFAYQKFLSRQSNQSISKSLPRSLRLDRLKP